MLLPAFAALSLAFAAPPPDPPRTPVLVELFTSEGCSSCPTADQALAALAALQPVAGVEIVPLAFHVDYWDRLGWKDPFSTPAWSARQGGYAALDGGLYTPQMVVDGRAAFVGDYDAAVAAAMSRRTAPRAGLMLMVKTLDDAAVVEARLDDGAPADAEVWVALSESGLAAVVPRGENAGRRLAHDGVVRRLVRVDRDAGPLRLALDPTWRRAALRVVAFAQRPRQGEVIAVATRALP